MNRTDKKKTNPLFLKPLIIILAIAIYVRFFYIRPVEAEIKAKEALPLEKDAPGKYVKVGKYKIHVQIRGEQNFGSEIVPLVLLHGWSTAAGITWLPWAEELAKTRTVIIPDMLGLGYSQRVTEPCFELTHKGQAKMLVEVLDALGVKKFDLVGRSLGGAISAELALDYPDRLRRLVLMAAYIYQTNAFADFFHKLGNIPFGIGKALTWNSMGGGPKGTATKNFAKGKNIERYKITLIKGTVDSLRTWAATPQATRLPDLGLIRNPTMVLWG